MRLVGNAARGGGWEIQQRVGDGGGKIRDGEGIAGMMGVGRWRSVLHTRLARFADGFVE